MSLPGCNFPGCVFPGCGYSGLWVSGLCPSTLEFRLAPSGLNIMQYFSFKQSWHERLVGLYVVNGLVFAIIFQNIEWGAFFPLSFQTCLLSSVLFFCFSLLKSELCLLKRFLNRPAVNPVYVYGGFPSCVITVA